jgi:hypothetical protein
MKKVIATCALFILVMAGKTFAQGVWKTTNGGATWSTVNDTKNDNVDFKLTQGENSVKVPRGTVKFFIDGAGMVTKVLYQDLLGRSTQLSPVKGTNGAPKPACKNPLPDACFGTADKNIGICICKPNDISGKHTISFYYVAKQISNVN